MTEKMYGEGPNAPVSTGVPFFRKTELEKTENSADIGTETAAPQADGTSAPKPTVGVDGTEGNAPNGTERKPVWNHPST